MVAAPYPALSARRLALHRLSNVGFWAMHAAPLALFVTGVRPADLALAAGLYVVRMFFITAGYHRYFAHRAYRLGRGMQFLMALGGSTCANKGVLWWAAHHRSHHRYSDTPRDLHSPADGFLHSHLGWFLRDDHVATDYHRVRDLTRFPELVWLNKNHMIPLSLLGGACFLVGGWSGFVAGFCLSTVVLWHATFAINSLAHLWGHRRYETADSSRNNFWLAIVTLGEGWHNNHHRFPGCVRQGLAWWEIDITYGVLKLLAAVGLVSGLRPPPAAMSLRKPVRPSSQ